MSTGKKIALGIVVLLVVLLVAAAVIVPLLFDVDRYRPQVAAHIQEQTGKPVQIGRLALTVFPTVSIRVDDFSLGNPPGFPSDEFIKTRRIYAVVDAAELWNRRIVIKSLQFDEPVINLLSDVRGKWNFESQAKPKVANIAAQASPSSFSLGVISRVTVSSAQVTVANLLASGQRGPNFFEAHKLSSDLEQVDLNAFIAATTMLLAPGPTSTPSEALAGWGTSVAYAAGPGGPAAAQGTLKADALRFQTLEITGVKSTIRLFPKQVSFENLNFDLYGGHSTGALDFNLAGQNPHYDANAQVHGVDIVRLLDAFPEARGKMTGKMEGNVKLSGDVLHSPDPLAGMRGTGQVNIRDGRLPSLQLGKNLMALGSLANLKAASGDPSAFSSISTDLTIGNERINFNQVTIVGNGLDVDGTGNLSLAGAGVMACDGVAKLAAGQNSVTDILASLSGVKFADGKLTLPFRISGTLQNPRFTLRSGAGAGNPGTLQGLLGGASARPGAAPPGQQNPAGLVQGIAGLFKKKQTPPQ
jgi:uncharacterized protein involved in outer membrane biogenesis